MTALIANLNSTVFGTALTAKLSPRPTQSLCHVSIARTSLDHALIKLAEECGLQLAHLVDDESRAISVGPLFGFFTRKEALDQLLLSTGLTYRFVNHHTVAIVRRADSGASRSVGLRRQHAGNGGRRKKAGLHRHTSSLSRFLPLFVVCGVMSVHPGHVCAKEAASGTLKTPALQEVVVTAERRAVNMQTTSVSETAVSGSAILNQHIEKITGLEALVPGLSVTSGGFTTNINIRGMGNTTASPNVTTGVPVFRDGLYEPEAILLNEPFYDIHDVEILKGPQGTIIGQNSTGGAVVINSNNPNFNGVNGYAQAIAGNYGMKRTDGAVNLPINHAFAARVAFNIEDRHSFFKNVGLGIGDATAGAYRNPGHVDEKNVRLGLMYEPNKRFRTLLKIEINDLSTGGLTARPLPRCSICAPDSTFYRYGYSGPSVYNGFQNLSVYQLDYNTPTMRRDTADRYGLHLRYILPGGVTLRSLTGYQRLEERRVDDVDASAAPVGVGGSFGTDRIGPDIYYSEELDLISPNVGRLTWLGGASYFYRSTPVDYDQYPYGATPQPLGAGGMTVLHIGAHVHLFGLFGQVSYQITPSVQLQVGARYSDDGQSSSGKIVIPLAGNLVIPNVGHYEKSVPSGKVALNWTPIPHQHLYVFWARGFKDGGINSAVSTFKPEYIDDYELGWKGQFLHNHLRTQLGSYYMNYRDMQQQVLNPLGGGNSVINLSHSKIEGVEFSSQAILGRWRGEAGVAFNHSALGAARAIAAYETPAAFNTNLPQCALGQATGCNDYSPYVVNLSGEADPYSPKFQGNISFEYVFDLGGSSTLAPRIEYSYTGKQWASIFQNTNYYLLGARKLLNLYLTWGYRSWSLQLYMRNATNETYIAGMGAAPTSTGGGAGADAFWGDPRTWGVSVMANF